MDSVFKGRYTATTPDKFVVFLIGMRVNRWWLFHKWLLVAMAMPKMLNRLRSDPKLGMFHAEGFLRFFPITTCMVSYWKDFESLENFAKNPNEPHLAPWGRYMKKIGSDGTVGVWHETYQIEKGQVESIYGNMPKFGLGAAFEHILVDSGKNTARQRIEP